MTAALFTFTLQSSVLLLAGIGASIALRRRSAAVRHWILAVAILASASLPLWRVVAPNWAVSPPAAVDVALTNWSLEAPGRDNAGEGAAQPGVIRAIGGPRGPEAPTATRFIVLVWAAGALTAFAWLLVGLARLGWISRLATPLVDPTWERIASSIAAELGLARRVSILQSPRPGLLAAWGWLRPRIVVSSQPAPWSERDVDIILRHELAHVARGDWAVQIAAECLRAVTWFSPLPWIVSRQLRAASEHACDDIVLNQGIPGADYAERLVALARTLGSHPRWSPTFPAPAMARPSSLERRVAAMLNARLSRSAMSPATRALVAAVAFAVAIPVAGVMVGAQAPAAFSGSVLDPANRAVPNAEVILTNTQTQVTQQVRSDATGRFAFAGLALGTYAMETRLPGFATLKGTVTVTQDGVKRDLSLTIGSVQETISIRVSSAPASPPAPAAAPSRPIPAPEPCMADSAIGGQIRPPLKVRHVSPTYPEHLKADRIEGVVVVEGILAADGTVTGLQVVETPNADLTSAVADAVGRWRFQPTLLNCQAVDIKIRINARFAFE